MKPVTHPARAEGRIPNTAKGNPEGPNTHKLPPPLTAAVPLMTRFELADFLRTTPRQISNMTARGQLPAAVRVAGLGLRWRRSEIDAWIAEQ